MSPLKAEEIVQSTECLFYRLVDLSLIPKTHIKNSSVVLSASPGEVETAESWGLLANMPSLLCKFLSQKNEMDSSWEMTYEVVFWRPHTCMHVLLHTQTREHINKAVPQHMSMKILCAKSQYVGAYWKKGKICTLLTFFIFPHHWQFGFYARIRMRLVKLIFFRFFEEKCAPKQSCYKVPMLLSHHGRILSSVKPWIGRKENFSEPSP